MKNGLWMVIIVVGVFMGFLMGYSLPTMIEVGMIGGGEKQQVGLQPDVSDDMQEYYKNLLKE